ncbi:MAG: AmmeMemoRadiSam system protein B [Patescibacteria group bacterium]
MITKSKKHSKITIRPALLAGSFYPADPKELRQLIAKFLNQSRTPKITGDIKALISPHAGLVYSGAVAAYGYKALFKNIRKKSITIIIIGPSHRYSLTGLAIDDSDYWQTPLGKTALNADLRDKLVKSSDLFKIDSLPHKQQENSLEIQLPFLQTVLDDFKILPVLVNQLTDDELEQASRALAQQIDNDTIIIASSDLSHYPIYDQANFADEKVNHAILSGQISKLRQTVYNLEQRNIPNLATCLCGQQAVEVVMETAGIMQARDIKLLKYANSGDTEIGDKLEVVGYGSIIFISQNQNFKIDGQNQKKLIEIARQSVESHITRGAVPEFNENSPILNKQLGAFVTLKKHGTLRGCIGVFEPNKPLYKTVSQMAIAAAFCDSRFSPVQKKELPELEYEISVLSPLKRARDWREIEIGRHGVEVRQGLHRGVFLPQVAAENNWGLDEFMDALCVHKAGLPHSYWKNPDAELYVFTAQVFGD